MQEMLDEIIQYIRGVWLKRRYILIVSWIACPIGWAMVTMLPNEYTSQARVYADTRSILQPLLRGLAVQTDPTRELQLMVKTLLSRTNLETIARDIDADVRATSSQEYEAILNDLKSNIRIKSAGRQNLYTISYSGNEPVYTKDVVQAALNVFVENTLSEQRSDADQANEIINDQITEYEQRLVEAENRLAEFQREYRGYMPGSDRGYYARLQQQKAGLEEAQLAMVESQSRYDSARTQLYKEEARAKAQLSRVKTEYDSRIEILQKRLDELLFRFTDRHPDVVETRRQLEELQKLKSDALAGLSVKEALASNPLYQDLKYTVNQLENEVASLQARITRTEKKIDDLQKKLDKVPDVEVKLKALDRDYEITKSKYEQLLTRRESALIAQSVGDSTDEIKFRIIDAPRVPNKASGPARPAMLVMVLILGFGAGIALSFVFSQLTPVISSTRQLQKLMEEHSVLGVVSATERSGLAAWEKRKMRIFIMFNLILFAVFAGFVVVNTVPGVRERLMQGINVL